MVRLWSGVAGNPVLAARVATCETSIQGNRDCPSGNGHRSFGSRTYRTTGAYEYERVGQKEHLVHPDSRRRCGGCLLGISKHPDAAGGCGELELGSLAPASLHLGLRPRAHRAQCESVGYGGGKHAPLRACRRDASALCRPAFHRVGQ